MVASMSWTLIGDGYSPHSLGSSLTFLLILFSTPAVCPPPGGAGPLIPLATPNSLPGPSPLLNQPQGSPVGGAQITSPAILPSPGQQGPPNKGGILAGVPTGLRSKVDTAVNKPSPTPGCQTTECVVVYPVGQRLSEVLSSVLTRGIVGRRFLLAPKIAECSMSIKAQPQTTGATTSEYQNVRSSPTCSADNSTKLIVRIRTPPSIYVVYPDPTVYDLCGNTAKPGDPNHPTTETYTPGQLSTLQALAGGQHTQQVFNFGDLPCPPQGIADQLEPGAPYYPVLVAPFDYYHTIDNSNMQLKCNISALRDPPGAAASVQEITGRGDAGFA